jgi:AcrR family transcriptional regulator
MSTPDGGRAAEGSGESPARARILDAAFGAFSESGYAATSTLKIATRARVSKRELYALVGNKQQMLVACITRRASRLGVPAHLPAPRDRRTLGRVLTELGAHLLREVSDPATIAVFRLAIAEAERAPEVARALDSIGREASRVALRDLLAQARSAGLVRGEPAQVAEHFTALLWGSLLVSLLLGVAVRPGLSESRRRARVASAAVLKLYPPPTTGGPAGASP